MRLFSWNVNGVRAATKKGLFEWLEHESPDILCIQRYFVYSRIKPPS